jgi:hypothetical protein
MSERILLDLPGVVITDQEARFPGGTVALDHIQRAWLVTRRPGLALGATLALLGAALLLRGAGPLRLVGLAVMAYGVFRAQGEEHALMLQIKGVASPQEALRTRDSPRARQALAALSQARLPLDRGTVRSE